MAHGIHLRTGAGAALTMAALTIPALAAPAAPATPFSAVSGAWVERDLRYRFDIHSGANPNQLVLTLPKDVQFPGDHTYALARTGPASFASKEQPNRPKVALTFKSAARGDLKLAGSGDTHAPHGGAWVLMQDFTLVRP